MIWVLKRSHMIERAFGSQSASFFAFSFEFNQPIEIYKFGATGWPRVVLLLLLLATIEFLLFADTWLGRSKGPRWHR